MKIKNTLISTLLLASVISFIPVKNAKASILIAAGASAYIGAVYGATATLNLFMPTIGIPFATVGSVAGGIVAIFNPTVGIIIIGLGEDGALSQNDLEYILSQKYPFIQDNQVLNDLALRIKDKAKDQKPVDGKIMVSLSEEEIKTILAGTDLLETNLNEVNGMIKDLK